MTALSPNAAKRALEGTDDHLGLAGWNHPELLLPDADLTDLRVKGEAYKKEAIAGVLARLQTMAVKVKDRGRSVPLVSVGMRYHLRQPAPTKTEVLLRLFRGTLPVVRLIDEPTLGDLHVEIHDLNAEVATRRARVSSDPFMSTADLDGLMRDRYGDEGALTANLLHRLVRAALVRSEVRTLWVGSVGLPATALFCDVEDVDGIIGRHHAGTLTPGEAAAFGRDIDVGPLLRQLRETGLSQKALAAELGARGIVTVRGAAWTGAGVLFALRKPPDQRIPAIATAPS